MAAFIGQLASVAASLSWSVTSVLFTIAGHEVGSSIVNRTRLLFALVFILITHQVLFGQPLPFSAEPSRWGWLSLSAVLGFILGDGLMFQAFLVIGPRLTLLMLSLSPIISSLLAWIFLGETLSLIELAGITVTVAGVVLVISDRQAADGTVQNERQANRLPGLLMGVGAAVGQAAGLLFSKLGLAGGFSPVSGNAIRLLVATLIMWLLATVRGQAAETFTKLREQRKTTWMIGGGSVLGPFLGVWLSLVAIQHAPLGVVSTLTNLAPIFVLPLSFIIFRERFGARAIIGTFVAFAGTAVLFLPT